MLDHATGTACVSNNPHFFLVTLSFPLFHALSFLCSGSLNFMLSLRNHYFPAIFLKPTPFLCHSSFSMLCSSSSPPPLSLYLLLLLHLFPASHFSKVVALYTHTPLPIKLSDPLHVSLTMKQITVLVPTDCTMHMKLDQSGTFQRAHDGGEESKGQLQQREERQRWITQTKIMCRWWKPPGVPALKSFTPAYAHTLMNLYSWQIRVFRVIGR